MRIASLRTVSKLVLVLLAVAFVAGPFQPALSAGKASPKRLAAARAARLEVLGEFDERIAARRGELETLLLEWFSAAVELPPEHAVEFEQLLGAARTLGSEKLAKSREEILAERSGGKAADATSASSLARRFRTARKGMTKALLDEAKEALRLDSGVRVHRVATALRELLDGNAVLAKALGKVKYKDTWLDATECAFFKKGFVWDGRFGWMRRRERERYDGGEYFDLDARRWTTLAKANEVHADPGKAWDIETEHFRFQGTAKLEDLLALIDVLKANRLRMFAVLSPLLDRNTRSPKERALMQLGEREHPPFRIYLSRTKKEYLEANPDMAGSAGNYDPAKLVSNLCQEDDSLFGTARHESMHQVFTEVLRLSSPSSSRSAGFPMWAEEGFADYFEKPTSDPTRFADLTEKDPAELRRLLWKTLSARSVDDWDEVVRATKSECYPMAKCLVTFLLESDGGRYEGNFFSFLEQAIREVVDPVQCLGLTREEFADALEAWLKRVAKPEEPK